MFCVICRGRHHGYHTGCQYEVLLSSSSVHLHYGVFLHKKTSNTYSTSSMPLNPLWFIPNAEETVGFDVKLSN